jgi:hypothetical protein
VAGNAEISRVGQDFFIASQLPDHYRFDKIGVLLVIDSCKVRAVHSRYCGMVFDVVEDGAIDAFANPLGKIAV